MIVNKDMSYDPSHRMPPRQERWPTATPAEGWTSYRDGEQEDLRYRAQRAAAGYRQQAVATAAYPPVTNDYDWSGNGYTGTAGGYAGARERGTLRLDGRDYVVGDCDVITVRFTP